MKRLPMKIGEKHGKLTVASLHHTEIKENKTVKYWLCLCACGNTAIVPTGFLRKGHTKSCGCLRQTYRSEDAVLRNLYAGHRSQARYRKLKTSLTFEHFCELVLQNCYYCGVAPSNVRKMQRQRAVGTPYPELIYNGLDRLDNSLGYEEGNVVACCQHCNRGKGAMAYTDFINLCVSIAERHYDRAHSTRTTKLFSKACSSNTE